MVWKENMGRVLCNRLDNNPVVEWRLDSPSGYPVSWHVLGTVRLEYEHRAASKYSLGIVFHTKLLQQRDVYMLDIFAAFDTIDQEIWLVNTNNMPMLYKFGFKDSK